MTFPWLALRGRFHSVFSPAEGEPRRPAPSGQGGGLPRPAVGWGVVTPGRDETLPLPAAPTPLGFREAPGNETTRTQGALQPRPDREKLRGSWTAPKEPSERLHPALNVKGAPASPAPAPSWDPLSSTGKPVTGRREARQSPTSSIPECETPLECRSLW